MTNPTVQTGKNDIKFLKFSGGGIRKKRRYKKRRKAKKTKTKKSTIKKFKRKYKRRTKKLIRDTVKNIKKNRVIHNQEGEGVGAILATTLGVPILQEILGKIL